jgi:glycosidase
VLYSLYPRAFTPQGTLDAARARLPEIRALGADAVWLLPIHPIGLSHRKGSQGSPYAIRDYRAVHPDLGTEADLRRFVDDAHQLGLRVIIDLVINHAAWDHPLAEREPGVFVRDGLGRPARRVAGWQDVVDWNYDHPAVPEHCSRPSATGWGMWASTATAATWPAWCRVGSGPACASGCWR